MHEPTALSRPTRSAAAFRFPRRPALHAAALLTLAAAASAEPLRAQFTPFEATLARFDAEVARGVADDAGGAVSVAVFRGDRVLWEKGWGWADIENGVPATAETIGRTGSISKSFTALLMMQLVERGLMSLDDPVADYLPEISGLSGPHPGAPPVTFRMLASHTAGLVREPGLADAAAGPIQRWEDKVLESIHTTTFLTPPLTEYAYSNIGFGILGLALSRAAGVPFMELMTTLVFRPLAMRSTFFVLEDPDHIARMSVGYSRGPDGTLSAEPATREHFGRGYKVPNGGIYSTVGDLVAFAAALMGRARVDVLGEVGRREMMTPQAPAEGYGLGLMIQERGGVHLIGHSGSVAGYNAYLAFDPESGLGVAMLRTTTYNPPLVDLLLALIGVEG